MLGQPDERILLDIHLCYFLDTLCHNLLTNQIKLLFFDIIEVLHCPIHFIIIFCRRILLYHHHLLFFRNLNRILLYQSGLVFFSHLYQSFSHIIKVITIPLRKHIIDLSLKIFASLLLDILEITFQFLFLVSDAVC